MEGQRDEEGCWRNFCSMNLEGRVSVATRIFDFWLAQGVLDNPRARRPSTRLRANERDTEAGTGSNRFVHRQLSLKKES